MTPKTALTKEEQIYWRFVASEKMYEALKEARTFATDIDSWLKASKNSNPSSVDSLALIYNLTEALALAEGRIE